MPETIGQLRHLVETAEVAIATAALVADGDPGRPRYHFRAPAQWMDDPNGIIYRDGWYHMMYSLNPHSAEHRAGMIYKTSVRVWDPQSTDWTGGITVWGHARSRDLVHWEHLPIALYPSVDQGEHFIWFGCTAINRQGTPMAFYTAVGPDRRPEDTAEQWAAVGSEDLTTWEPARGNPILDYDAHQTDVITEWRDPFLFTTDGRDFMVLGGRDGNGVPVVTLYEAEDAAFQKWRYRGIVFRYQDASFPSCECPNFVLLDGRWVLLLSPHGPVEYFVGDLDVDAVTFTYERHGRVDESPAFYATNVLIDNLGRQIMWGAVEGFQGTTGWNGCVSLPRVISLSNEGMLVQRVAEELRSLHGSGVKLNGTATRREHLGVTASGGDGCFHIHGNILLPLENRGTLTLISGTTELELVLGIEVDVAGSHLQRLGEDTEIDIWIDRRVVEIFVDGIAATTLITNLWGDGIDIRVDVETGPGAVDLQIWPLNARNLFTDSPARNAILQR